MLNKRLFHIRKMSRILLGSILIMTIIMSIQQINCNTITKPIVLQQSDHHRQLSSHTIQPSVLQKEVLDTNSLYGAHRYVNNPQHIWNRLETTSRTRKRRSTANEQTQHKAVQSNQQSSSYVDACPSKMEIITPYYATNSKGKLRNVVNSELMQQAIQIETCLGSPSNQAGGKCNSQGDCACEQKYRWHRLLVTNPRDPEAAHSLFTDWFLFPSNCVCRCQNSHNTRQFLKLINKKN